MNRWTKCLLVAGLLLSIVCFSISQSSAAIISYGNGAPTTGVEWLSICEFGYGDGWISGSSWNSENSLGCATWSVNGWLTSRITGQNDSYFDDDDDALQFEIPPGLSFTLDVNGSVSVHSELALLGGWAEQDLDFGLSFAALLGARQPDARLPEPATLALWSVGGLCWGAAKGWRRRRSTCQRRQLATRLRTTRFQRRPPWPDHVRAAILEIVTRDLPRQKP